MDRLGLADLRHKRDCNAPPDGSGADPCSALCLFTLVGIAGEDDIDAPDLKAPMPPASAAATPAPNRYSRLNGLNGGQTIPGRGGSRVVLNPVKSILGPEASAASRNQLVEELRAIASSDDAAIWAHRILGVKNRLIEADARQVEGGPQSII